MRGRVVVEIIWPVCDGEDVVFSVRVGLLVEGDGSFEGSLADVAPLSTGTGSVSSFTSDLKISGRRRTAQTKSDMTSMFTTTMLGKGECPRWMGVQREV